MCQWKFFVFKYSANTSARIAFIAPEISLVASGVRSVRVSSGASRLRRSSAFLGFDLAICRPSVERVVLIAENSKHNSSTILSVRETLHCRERDIAESLFQGSSRNSFPLCNWPLANLSLNQYDQQTYTSPKQ